MENKTAQLIQECKRQSESCLYTSTALFIWLRTLRGLKVFFIIAPLTLGSIASGRLLLGNFDNAKIVAAICAFFAGILPSIYSALKYDDRLKECASLASEFKNLQDGFRVAALVYSEKSFEEFEARFCELVQRLEKARSVSFTAPEWCFKMAQRKIKGGDYHFDVDIGKGLPQQ